MGISTEQRAWLKGLGDIVGEPAAVDEDEAPADDQANDVARDAPVKIRRRLPRQALADVPVLGEQGNEQGGEQGGQRFGFGPEDILPVIPDLIDGLTDRRATCAIHNNTQQVLKLDTASLDEIDDESGKTPGILHGQYVVFPQSQVAAGDQSGRFVAENNKVGPLSTTGAEGFVKYVLDPQGTAWIVHFNNPFGVAGEGSDNSADARVEGPNAAQFESPKPGMSGTNDVKYLFILNAKGGTGPVIPPQPLPATDVPSSCQITINNQTQQPLSLADQGHDRGDFMSLVPTSIAPGASITVASVETPNAADEGCKGFIVWEVGSPMLAAWRIEWDNPEGAKNTTNASLTPQEAGFKSIDQIGQGEENVPVQFTISGGGGGGGGGDRKSSCLITVTNNTEVPLTLLKPAGSFRTGVPSTVAPGESIAVESVPADGAQGTKGALLWQVGAADGPKWINQWDNPEGETNSSISQLRPEGEFTTEHEIGPGDEEVPVQFSISSGGEPKPKEVKFVPPPESKQPTLRKGDKSEDKWVEYAQFLLKKSGADLEINGVFDSAMDAEVKKYQAAQDPPLMVDGIIGNQTWASLREGTPENPSTDGRKPHTYVEKGPEARWSVESSNNNRYVASSDTFEMAIDTVGDTPLDPSAPYAKATIKITPPGKAKEFDIPAIDDAGFHRIVIKKFRETFGLPKGTPVDTCQVDAYLHPDLGGDNYSAKVRQVDEVEGDEKPVDEKPKPVDEK